MKFSRCLAFASLALLLAVFSVPARAQSGNSFLKGLQYSGSVDGYASWNSNSPQNGMNALYPFAYAADSFSLNLAELKIVKPVSKPGDIGFTAELGYGDAIDVMTPTGPAKNLIQGYVTWLAPVGKGLTLDFGKFSTNIGAEVIENPGNWNYTRSILFSWAIPFYHTGVRATYAVNGKFSFYGMVVNGWNTVTDNNRAKSFGTGFTWTPTSKFTFIENYMVGPEQTGDNKDYRNLTDTVVTYAATPKVTLLGNYDYGHDTLGGVTQTWQGVAGYVRLQATPKFAITPRVEYYNDPQGFTTGTAQKLWEFTLTPEYKIGDHLAYRAEFRHDQSDQPFFQVNSGSLVKTQNTITMGMILSF